MIEYSVIIKDTNTRLVDKDTSYEPITLDKDDPELKRIVDAALLKFPIDMNTVDKVDIIFKATMVLQ